MISVNRVVKAREYEYKGLSTDDKPTNCADNSLFMELDTGDFYYFADGVWTKIGESPSPQPFDASDS